MKGCRNFNLKTAAVDKSALSEKLIFQREIGAIFKEILKEIDKFSEESIPEYLKIQRDLLAKALTMETNHADARSIIEGAKKILKDHRTIIAQQIETETNLAIPA